MFMPATVGQEWRDRNARCSFAGMSLDVSTLAYIAAILDSRAVIRQRTVGETDLPYLAVSCPDERLLDLLCRATAIRKVVTRREYAKAGCAEHCQEKHVHTVSRSMRWSVTGVKATVVLDNCLPYMQIQQEEAMEVLAIGLTAPYKAAALRRMAELGWDVSRVTGPRPE